MTEIDPSVPSADFPRQATRPEPLTLCSYNIHACVGGDGELRPERTARVLREIGASI